MLLSGIFPVTGAPSQVPSDGFGGVQIPLAALEASPKTHPHK